MTEQGQFQFQVFEETARTLGPEITTLVASKDFAPPFEVMFADADNRLICCLEIDAQGNFRNLLDSDPPLWATFPVKASVTDRSGNIWHASFDAPEFPSLE